MRQLVRQHLRFFLLTTLGAIALRLGFIFRFPAITADSFIYGDIAKNWLEHGIFGVSVAGYIAPTYIRLPGYPAFLAAVFAVFGMEHYQAAMAVQLIFDLGTCLLIADMARRLISERAARIAFLLAALCPFLANYVAAALTETLEIFFTALALDCALAGLEALGSARLRAWAGCGAAIGGAILLRPDGGLLLITVGVFLGTLLLRRWRDPAMRAGMVRAGIVVALLSLAPLAPWTIRNFGAFHTFQPLVPRYAEQGEYVPIGFNRWVKTWIADYVSVEEIYWAVPESDLDVTKLPNRAFDSEAQRRQTTQLFQDYNRHDTVTPELDARFEALAEERIRAHPLRYYVWLPAVRIADMWLRPRTELLPSDSRWWEFDDDPRWLTLALVMGAINLLYVGAAVVSCLKRVPKLASAGLAGMGLLLAFVAIRSMFLGTLENPEPRYTLECYPVVVALVSALFQ